MMIYVRDRSKPKGTTKKQQVEYQEWLNSLQNQKTNFTKGNSIVKKSKVLVTPRVPPGRETPRYPSVDTGGGTTTKPIHGKVYTGSLMKGIGTLHKSNAVPIFSDEEARDQAAMRR